MFTSLSPLAALTRLLALGQSDAEKTAWALLKTGLLDEAYAKTTHAVERESGPGLHHILFNIHYLRGEFELAMARYESIPADYARLPELDDARLAGLRFLGRDRDALEFARFRRRSPGEIAVLEHLSERPFVAELDRRIAVPFADHPLTPYFPGFHGAINEQHAVVHMDTGGTYLVMGPARAQSLGIELRDAGLGHHGPNRVAMRMGIAESFRLGEATLRNVPVSVLETLAGEQDFVIFGTNVLQQFLSTFDYSHRRLLLSPRGDAEATREHANMLPPDRVEIPFLMWSDHYMLAQGRIGDSDAWFFVDSGIVMIEPWQGSEKQIALLASRRQFRALGLDPGRSKSGPMALPSIGFGRREQTGHIGIVNNACPTNLGGVAVNALLSHAYLSAYTWTLDFERRTYGVGSNIEGIQVP